MLERRHLQHEHDGRVAVRVRERVGGRRLLDRDRRMREQRVPERSDVRGRIQPLLVHVCGGLHGNQL